MIFQGAFLNANSSDLTSETAIHTVIFDDLINNGRSLEGVISDADRYLGCEFTPESLGDFEDMFLVFKPIPARRIAFSRIHADQDSAAGMLPPIDIGFEFDIPLVDKNTDRKLVLKWSEDKQINLVDAVNIHWRSIDEDHFFALDVCRTKVLYPKK